MSEIQKLIEKRDKEYGNSWLITGQLINVVSDLFTNFQREAPELLIPWMMMLNKMVRLLFTPHKEDTWQDIAGYAQLVLRHFDVTRPERPGNFAGVDDHGSIIYTEQDEL